MTSSLAAQKKNGAPFEESRGLFEALFEYVPEAVVVSDETGCIVQVNAQVEKLFGYSRDELRGQPIEILVPQRFGQAHVGHRKHYNQDPRRRAMGAGLELRGRHKNGREFLIDVMLNPLETGQGELVLSLIRDITQSDTGDDLRFHLAALVNSSGDAIIGETLDGVITSWNQSAERIFGYSAEEAIGKPMSILLPPGREDEESDVLGRLERGETINASDAVRIRKDGRDVDVSVTTSPIFGPLGNLVGASKVARDITERKQASRYARSLLEASLDPLVTISSEGKITDVNEATVKVTGVPREKLIGTDFANYFTEPEKARVGYQRVFSEGFVTGYPLTIRHAEGLLTDVLYNASLYKDTDGRVLGVFASARDITERKLMENERAAVARSILRLNQELEQRVKTRTAELAASNKELEAFAYSVSHDLRAPLRHIDGFLALLQKRVYAQLDPSAQHYIDNTTQACRRLGQMIDELLQFSRLGRSEIHKQPVDLNQMVQKVLQELEPESQNRVVRWHVDDLPSVAADQLMLRQILENLLGNALKFTRTRAEAEIFIRSRREPDGNIAIYVRDNGVGFDMQYSSKLFQVFQRLHHEDEFEGTGIGLAIVRRMVERHGGRVWAEGALDQGATFYFSLPASDPSAGARNELAESYSSS